MGGCQPLRGLLHSMGFADGVARTRRSLRVPFRLLRDQRLPRAIHAQSCQTAARVCSQPWSDGRLVAAVVVGVAMLGVASFASIYGAGLTYYGDGPIRSDGLGYYVYLPAALLHHELTMERTADRSFGGDPTNIPGVRRTPPYDRPLNQFGIGEAVMIAPFFGVGHLTALIAGSPRDGFSWPYQATATCAGFVYALLGLVVLASVLRRWFGRGTVVLTLLATTFGTNLFHYATYDSLFSHAFSFALVAVIVRLTIAVADLPRVLPTAALGASIGLLTLVRPTNLDILVFCALYGVCQMRDLRRRLYAFARRIDLVAIGCGVFLLVAIPQVAYWHAITGNLIANGYVDERLDLLRPHVFEILFSVRKGLFFWTPLLLLAVAGVPFLRRLAPPLFIATVAYLLVHTWIVASWSTWWYGGSFGMRPFVDALPVLALGLAALFSAAESVRARRLVLVGAAVTSLLAVHAMIAYWTKAVPLDGTTFTTYLKSFWEL